MAGCDVTVCAVLKNGALEEEYTITKNCDHMQAIWRQQWKTQSAAILRPCRCPNREPQIFCRFVPQLNVPFAKSFGWPRNVSFDKKLIKKTNLSAALPYCMEWYERYWKTDYSSRWQCNRPEAIARITSVRDDVSSQSLQTADYFMYTNTHMVAVLLHTVFLRSK